MINDAGIFDTREGVTTQPKPANRNFTDAQGNIVDIDEFAPTTGDSQNFDWKLSQVSFVICVYRSWFLFNMEMARLKTRFLVLFFCLIQFFFSLLNKLLMN